MTFVKKVLSGMLLTVTSQVDQNVVLMKKVKPFWMK